MNSFTKIFLGASLAAFLTSCATNKNSGWITLFDGKSTDAFRGYKKDSFPKCWTVDDGVLKAIPGDDVADLVTKEEFENFDLRLEWRISPGGNSGVMYHVQETFDHPFMTGPEMQVLDD